MSIEKQLDLKFPIYWNNWPIGKEFAKYLIYTIVSQRPINIVELGGGTSTLIILKTFKKLGCKCNLISFDSDKNFLEKTKNILMAEDVYDESVVKLVYASIDDLEINKETYKWYDKDKFNFNFKKIDLLFIDGPKGSLCKKSRYPALKIMKKYLKDGSVAILHDAKRADEQEIVDIWKKENPSIKSISEINTRRGGVEISF